MDKSIKKNTLLNIIKTCSSILFPLITFPYISRVLLPENVGKVNFAQSFVTYFLLISGLGITTYAIRECAAVREDKNKLSDVASQLFSINLCTTVISYILMVITLLIGKNLDVYRTLIIIESTTILFTTLGADWLNSAMEDFKYITLRTIGFQMLSLILMFIFVENRDDYIAYAIISVFSSSGANVVNIIYRKKYCTVKFTRKINWKRHMPPIFLLFVMMLSQTIFNNADITMLGLMKGDYEVGLYSTAHKLTRLIGQVVQAVIYVVLPRLSQYFSQDNFKEANKLLRKILSFNISLGLPCVVGVLMLSEDIVFVVGGSEFMEAAPVIRVLILAFMFSLVGGSFLGNAILIPTKREKYYMIVCMIAAVVNVVLNALLIPHFAAVGAAIATAFNGFLIFVLLLLKVDKRIHIARIGNIFASPVVGCIMIAICCHFSSFIENMWARICISVISSIIVYAFVLIKMKNDLAIETWSQLKNKLLKK